MLRGRLTGVSTGTATISVKVRHDDPDDQCAGCWTGHTNRPIVKRIHGSGLFSDRRNILLLGDGFSNVTDFERLRPRSKTG